ncbi:MAG: response regulator [Bacteroidetes bacterium]|nr:response regulator [Bacteroidota bacterium]
MQKIVLIVEDNEKSRRLFRDILQMNGYQTIEAENGLKGIELTRKHKPDIVLMDIQMPVLDGYEAAKILKNSHDTRGIKIIALTSYAMKDDEERFLDAGFDDYISKPIDIKQFLLQMAKNSASVVLNPEKEHGGA